MVKVVRECINFKTKKRREFKALQDVVDVDDATATRGDVMRIRITLTFWAITKAAIAMTAAFINFAKI